MSIGFRRNAAFAGLSLLVSLAFAAWDPLNSGVVGPLYSVHFPEGTQVGYAVGAGQDSVGGEIGLIVKTTNGGDTWVVHDLGSVQALRSVYFKDNDNGFAVGDQGAAVRTTDGGATWIPMTVPSGTDMLTYVRFPENGQTGYIGVYPRTVGGKVLKTTDGGDDWTSIGVGGPGDWSYSCGMATDNIGVVVGYEGWVYGITDSAQDPHTTADIVAATFSPTDPNEAYLIGNDSTRGVIRYTDDGGATPWDSVRCYPITAFYGIDFATSDVAYVCGAGGRIDRSVSPHDFFRTTTGVTADMYGVCFPNGVDTGYAVGSGGTILRTYDGGLPFVYAVSEGKGPGISRAGIRVVSNPSRRGITLRADADADADVVVLDAAGRVVARQAATRGLNFLPLLKAGVYVVRVTTDGFSTTQKLVVEH